MDKNWEAEGLGGDHFHSSREERQKHGNVKGKIEKTGFFNKNPSFRIVLIDLIFIVIISGVIVPFIMKREGSSSIDNYKLTFKAFSFDDEILLTLKIAETKDLESTGLVEAEFYHENSSSRTSELELLPSNLESRIIKSRLNQTSGKYAFCEVFINNEKRILKKRIQ